MTSRVDSLDDQIADVVARDSRARLLLTHPAVGPLTALTTALVLDLLARFPDSKLLVRLYIMLRDHIGYDEFRRRGRAASAQHAAMPIT